MVTIEEIADDEFGEQPLGYQDDENEWGTDDGECAGIETSTNPLYDIFQPPQKRDQS